MRTTMTLGTVLLLLCPALGYGQGGKQDTLLAGFGEADLTPQLGAKPVYVAGFGQNRKATKVHDPLMARAVVLRDGTRKIALVSVDLVGLFFEQVQLIRKELPGFDYVLVSSTHNHEGPDTLGLWGPHPFQSGVDPDYLKLVRDKVIEAVQQANKKAGPVTALLGTAAAPELLHDGRQPLVKHDTLVALQFQDKTGKPSGIVVQWNCHPETLDSKNTELSADYVAWTVAHLQKKYQCPVVYFTGTVGGLMTSLHVPVADEKGEPLKDGTFAKTIRFGELVGRAAEKSLAAAKPVTLTPFAFKAEPLYLPIDNSLYVFGWQSGVLKRAAYLWQGKPNQAGPELKKLGDKERACILTEVGLLRLGQLEVAAIPGEIYPELVLDKVQDPIDPGADFPDAPVEPGIYAQLKAPHRMLIGLANDEIGYIIPKRQWDAQAPFCYGLKKSQYGEVNSLGPDTAPLLCAAFKQMAQSLK